MDYQARGSFDRRVVSAIVDLLGYNAQWPGHPGAYTYSRGNGRIGE